MHFLALLGALAVTPPGTSEAIARVPLSFAPMPAEILGWRGWEYLRGAKAAEWDPYTASYDLTPVKPATVPKGEAPVDWHERVVIFTGVETLITDDAGVVHADRHSFESAALKRAQSAVDALGAWISFETAGRVKLVPEVTVEKETIRSQGFGPEFAQSYFGPRINGGGYEAEDKVFRGPYQGAIYILPGIPAPSLGGTRVNGTPVEPVWEYEGGVPYAPGGLEISLHQAWLNQVRERLEEREVNVTANGTASNVWSEAASTAELPTETLLARIGNPTTAALFTSVPDVDPQYGFRPARTASYLSASTEVSLSADPDHGQTLHVVERGVDRNGGFALPIRADGHPLAHISQTPTLTFDVKSSSADPIGVVVSSHDRSVEYSLGRQSILGGWGAHLVAMPPATGGTWRKVSLDLRPLASAGQGDDVTGIEIRPTEAARRTGRILPDPIEIDLDNVRFTADSPTAPLADPRADATSGDPEERALFAAKAMESSPALVALLTDKSEFVRLNAAQAYSRVKDPAAQPNLLSDASDLDPAVSAAALRGIAFTGGPDAIATVRHAVRFGITPLARATAAEILGETKNPAFGDDIVSLIVDRSRLCRLASVAALAGLPGHENSVRRWAFIIQDDPEIKLAVTRTANPTEDNEVRKLLWSAVNEPSDLVRAESDVKLIQASDPAARSEGYKGVRDDSTTVRLYLLKYLEAHPAESHRAALRLAITDRSPRVRAEALLAFGALDKGAEPDEISNVMQDRDPGVELALIALSKKRGLKLSDQTRQLMVTSPDPRVKQALEGQ